MDLYDEVYNVQHSREIDSPAELDVKSSLAFVNEKTADLSDEELSMSTSLPLNVEKPKTINTNKAFRKIEPGTLTPHSTSESESEAVKVDQKKDEHAFDPKLFENLDAPPEIKEIFEFIPRFTPQRIIIDYKLKVFIPEYIPAVGDIDAFLKCNEPATPIEDSTGDQKIAAFIKKLGLEILDEPCGEQSDPVLLQMKLRAIYPKAMETPSSVAKSPKDVDRWISEIQALHASQPSQNLLMKKSLPNIDHLMTEWPEEMEKMLETVGFPAANLDVSLKNYIEIVCGIFDIPIPSSAKHSDYVAALYTLFNLFIAVRGQSRVQ